MTLSLTDRLLLETFNYHCAQHDYVTLTQLAKECSVAKSTVEKFAQKLGYENFVDLRESAFQENADSSNFIITDIVEGDLLEAADSLATIFYECRHKKNFIHTNRIPPSSILAPWLSRKLSMLDILAPASYDYAQILDSQMPLGFEIFFNHKMIDSYVDDVPINQPIIEITRNANVQTILLGDNISSAHEEQASLAIRIGSSISGGADLFIARCMILLELSLSEFASLRDRENSKKPAHSDQNATNVTYNSPSQNSTSDSDNNDLEILKEMMFL